MEIVQENYGKLESLSSNISIPTLVKKLERCKGIEIEVSYMIIDFEHVSKNPRTETPPSSDFIIQEEEIEEVERYEILSHESIITMQHFPTIETSQERVEGIQIDSSNNIVAQYNTMRIQTTMSTQEKSSQARGGVKNKLVMLSDPSLEENVFNIDILEPMVKPTSSTQDYRASQIKINLDQFSVVDKINLHKQIGEVIFSNLL